MEADAVKHDNLSADGLTIRVHLENERSFIQNTCSFIQCCQLSLIYWTSCLAQTNGVISIAFYRANRLGLNLIIQLYVIVGLSRNNIKIPQFLNGCRNKHLIICIHFVSICLVLSR